MALHSSFKQVLVSGKRTLRLAPQRIIQQSGRDKDGRRTVLSFLAGCGLCTTGQPEAGIGIKGEKLAHREIWSHRPW